MIKAASSVSNSRILLSGIKSEISEPLDSYRLFREKYTDEDMGWSDAKLKFDSGYIWGRTMIIQLRRWVDNDIVSDKVEVIISLDEAIFEIRRLKSNGQLTVNPGQIKDRGLDFSQSDMFRVDVSGHHPNIFIPGDGWAIHFKDVPDAPIAKQRKVVIEDY